MDGPLLECSLAQDGWPENRAPSAHRCPFAPVFDQPGVLKKMQTPANGRSKPGPLPVASACGIASANRRSQGFRPLRQAEEALDPAPRRRVQRRA